ncbi:LysR family transcriptional regulator [Luteolibacter pohnpeiensis]|uniref:LysR family transcriptional regulator n=1 Tax=Luteolibacter pohnpeiensis TaxID=454153 RepID=A0A934S8H2_9BACT|nr:LysR substrate-binding domain-containing protein [Luteolibacter pohnpeiensis]MBK1881304.1 LysR family transcriptional regulator [Luteolibacter pohnpeiensis]
MPFPHHIRGVLVQIRSFLTIVEEGSLRRAADRLRVSQSTLTRQIQALEHEIGGRLLERTSSGVLPTNGGHALAERMRSFLSDYDDALLEVRRLVRGESEQLRIGFIASAAAQYLQPLMSDLREHFPGSKVRMLDLSPGEQISALRRGEIDLALIDQGSELLSRDFYVRKIAEVPSEVILPKNHPLASRTGVSIADLKDETFVKGPDADLPGYEQRLVQLCWKLGKFRPKFIGQPDSLADGLSMVANEDAVLLVPGFDRQQMSACFTTCFASVPITDPGAVWDLSIAWQRGRASAPLRFMIDSFSKSGSIQQIAR